MRLIGEREKNYLSDEKISLVFGGVSEVGRENERDWETSNTKLKWYENVYVI